MVVNEQQMKDVIKEAMWELVQEKREEFSEIFGELLEDVALARAIREGETSEPVGRDEVMALLGASS